jgi:hypothetical protein
MLPDAWRLRLGGDVIGYMRVLINLVFATMTGFATTYMFTLLARIAVDEETFHLSHPAAGNRVQESSDDGGMATSSVDAAHVPGGTQARFR